MAFSRGFPKSLSQVWGTDRRGTNRKASPPQKKTETNRKRQNPKKPNGLDGFLRTTTCGQTGELPDRRPFLLGARAESNTLREPPNLTSRPPISVSNGKADPAKKGGRALSPSLVVFLKVGKKKQMRHTEEHPAPEFGGWFFRYSFKPSWGRRHGLVESPTMLSFSTIMFAFDFPSHSSRSQSMQVKMTI